MWRRNETFSTYVEICPNCLSRKYGEIWDISEVNYPHFFLAQNTFMIEEKIFTQSFGLLSLRSNDTLKKTDKRTVHNKR
jgi:hypothetical protein